MAGRSERREYERSVASELPCFQCGAMRECKRPDGEVYTNGFVHEKRIKAARYVIALVEGRPRDAA